MNDIKKRIQSLPAEKLKLINRRLKLQQRISDGYNNVIPKRTNANTPPLSLSQLPLWFFDQIEPCSAVYNRCANYRLRGALNIEALQQALVALVAHQEILRTTFKMEGNEPVQVIVPERHVDLPILDLSDQDIGNRKAALQRLTSEEAQRPFALAQGPLLRTTLLKLAERDHILMVTTHHIISDGWSTGIFNRELSHLYNGINQGRPAELPVLPVQYADYAQWQREWMQGKVLEGQLDYWKKQLEGAPPLLEFPTDRPRPAIRTFRGNRQSIILPNALRDALNELSGQEGATLFMILLGAFQVLLHRYTGQEDIVVGTPIANRRHSEIEGLIGLFINVLVLRSDLSGNPTFQDLIKRVREVALGAYDHQDLPFGKLVEELHPGRNLSYSPLFQIMFAYQNIPKSGLTIDGLDVTHIETNKGTAHFDLSLITENDDQGLKATLEYNTDLFDTATISRMLSHYQILLESFTLDSNQAISTPQMLSGTERHQLLVEWNKTGTDYPDKLCIHQLFEQQVDDTPDAIAVSYEGRQLTYQELNARANQLAHTLQARGVGSNDLVGIAMERSPELIIGILGILKAGGGYVPLDLEYPEERLAFMIDDTQISLLLALGKHLDHLPANISDVICLDADWHDVSNDTRNIDSPVTSESLAYVIYTSGSTGKPKGVPVPHSAVNRLVLNTNYISLGNRDKVAQVSNISFDAATFEIWGALLNGATLVGIKKETMLSADLLSDKFEKDHITAIFLTTAVFNQLVGENPVVFRSLHYLLFGGESADPEKVRKVLKTAPPRHLVNAYGPTENTTFSTWYEVLDFPDDAWTVPIGRPISNTQVYILDRNMNPVPIGVYGELYLGGEGLALGYLNNRSLSSERFVSNPFNRLSGSRLYKTGDVVRYRADGVIEFRGRTDHQVKVRGFRIEPGEIEAALKQYNAVEEAIVLVMEKIPDEKRLIAYVTLKKPAQVTKKNLRSFLGEKLPDYMMPVDYMILENFPLTSNGKIDRQALPAEDISVPLSTQNFTEPRTKTEKDLVTIWGGLFENKKIGIHDNFFHLGGHSLLAARLFYILRKRYKRDLPLITIYQAGTIEQIARILTEDSWQQPSLSSLAAVQSSGSRPPFFWALGAKASSEASQFFHTEQPFYVLQHQSQDGSRARYTNVEAIAEWYVKDIRSIQPQGPYFLGGFSFGGLVAYEIAQQLIKCGESVELLFLLDPTGPGERKIKNIYSGFIPGLKGDNFTTITSKKLSVRRIRHGLLRKAGRIVRPGIKIIKETIKKLVCEIYIASKTPIPVSLRSFYTIRVYRQAAQQYLLTPYSGKIVLYQFINSSTAIHKNHFIECNKDTGHYVASGEHSDVVSKSHALAWAEQLKESLEAAQTRSL